MTCHKPKICMFYFLSWVFNVVGFFRLWPFVLIFAPPINNPAYYISYSIFLIYPTSFQHLFILFTLFQMDCLLCNSFFCKAKCMYVFHCKDMLTGQIMHKKDFFPIIRICHEIFNSIANYHKMCRTNRYSEIVMPSLSIICLIL